MTLSSKYNTTFVDYPNADDYYSGIELYNIGFNQMLRALLLGFTSCLGMGAYFGWKLLY